MSAQPQCCARCGRAFDCGMNQRERCWCSTDFPPVMPLPGAERGCFCRACMTELIAAAQQEKRVT